MLAKDIMSAAVITVTPETSVKDIANLLFHNHISAVPVVDADGTVRGMVSEGDLLRRHELDTERRRSWWLSLFTTADERAKDYIKSHGRHANDVMTRGVVTVHQDAPLNAIADLLEKHRIKRVPVVQNGKLIGIVSRANVIQGLVAGGQEGTTLPSADDRTIRKTILKELEENIGIPTTMLNVIVENGAVHLWGVVDSADEREAAKVASENVPGVKRVENYISLFNVARAGGI